MNRVESSRIDSRMKLRKGKEYHPFRSLVVIGIDPLFWKCYQYVINVLLMCDPKKPHSTCYNKFVKLYLSPRKKKNGEVHINIDRYEDVDIFLHPNYYCDILDRFIQRRYTIDMLFLAKRFLRSGERRRFHANRF